MYTIKSTPQAILAERFVRAEGYEKPNLTRAEDTGDHKLPLKMKWVVDLEGFGNPRLQVRWTVAPLVW